MFEIQKASTDFVAATNGIDFVTLQDSIWVDAGITTLFHGCRSENDFADIWFVFDSEPSIGEKTILDGLVAAHTGKPAELSALDKQKAESSQLLDDCAGEARARYITVAPGQDAVYIKKEEQSQKYKDAGYPADETGYELVTAQKNADSSTATEAADYILATAASWKILAANIEELRMSYKNQIAAAVDVNSVIALANKGKALLDAI
jgi:hypothetical protein